MVYEAVDVDANIIFGALIDDSIVDGQVASSSYTTLHYPTHIHTYTFITSALTVDGDLAIPIMLPTITATATITSDSNLLLSLSLTVTDRCPSRC